jgi:hypothetical protein
MLSVLRFLVLGFLLTYSIGWSATLDSGLVGHYEFSGNASDSLNNLQTSVSGGSFVADRFMNDSSAFRFQGYGDQIEATGSLIPYGSQARTISVWAKADDYLRDGKVIVLGSFSSGNLGDVFGLITRPDWTVWANGFAYEVTGTQMDLSWHNHILTYDSSAINYFYDGILVGSAQWTIDTYNSVLSMGSIDGDPSGYYFHGSVDDVRLYNRSLSNTEAAALYANESVPEPSALSLLGIGLSGLAMMRRRRS